MIKCKNEKRKYMETGRRGRGTEWACLTSTCAVKKTQQNKHESKFSDICD